MFFGLSIKGDRYMKLKQNRSAARSRNTDSDGDDDDDNDALCHASRAKPNVDRATDRRRRRSEELQMNETVPSINLQMTPASLTHVTSSAE